MKEVIAQSETGPQKELVKTRNISGTQISLGAVPRDAIAGMVNANRSERTSFRKK